MKRIAEVKSIHFFETVAHGLRLRHDLHLARKVWHLFMGLFIVSLYVAGISRVEGVFILGFFLLLDLWVEHRRLRNVALNDKILRFWGPLMRSHETSSFSTIPHYLSASLIAIGLFPKPIAILSILYLACGDPLASLFGIAYGHLGPKLPKGKTLIGSLAGILVCSLISLIYFNTLTLTFWERGILTLLGGLSGGLAELLPFEIDDNFIIPVVSGFILWFGFMLFGL